MSLSIAVIRCVTPRSRYRFSRLLPTQNTSFHQKMSSIAAFFSSFISTVHADTEQPEAEVEVEAPEQPVAEQEEEEEEPEDVRIRHLSSSEQTANTYAQLSSILLLEKNARSHRNALLWLSISSIVRRRFTLGRGSSTRIALKSCACSFFAFSTFLTCL